MKDRRRKTNCSEELQLVVKTVAQTLTVQKVRSLSRWSRLANLSELWLKKNHYHVAQVALFLQVCSSEKKVEERL